MSDKISLSINNLGLISNADLEIAKLNVVVGKNSTGKSTSSKFLYCLLTASSRDGIYLANRDISKRFRDFIAYWSVKISGDLSDFEELSLKLRDDNISNAVFDKVYAKLKGLASNFTSADSYLNDLESIYNLVKINRNSKLRHISTFNSLLDSEYGDFLKDNSDTHIRLYGDGFSQDIEISNSDKNWNLSDEYLTYFNFKNIIYIDSPAVLDFENDINRTNQIHFQLLNKKLRKAGFDIYDDEAYKKVIEFKKRVDDLIDGKFIYDNKSGRFFLKKDNAVFPMQATASGLKQLGIVQMLLANNELCEDCFLIMDEPEVNLHPEFQIKFAEILVLASKELNISIYINTHSPFFAEAIEVYSRYHGIYDDTNFYLTEKAQNGLYDYRLIDDVDIMKVYINLGNPFDILNEIRFKMDLEGD